MTALCRAIKLQNEPLITNNKNKRRLVDSIVARWAVLYDAGVMAVVRVRASGLPGVGRSSRLVPIYVRPVTQQTREFVLTESLFASSCQLTDTVLMVLGWILPPRFRRDIFKRPSLVGAIILEKTLTLAAYTVRCDFRS